jgi:hypothetical protein
VCHQASDSFHLSQDGGHFIRAQHNRQSIPPLDALQFAEMTNLDLKDIAIQEQQSVERLGLSGCCDTPHGGQMVHEAYDATRAHSTRALPVMEMDVPADPEPVRLFGPAAQMPPTAYHRHLVHEPQWGSGDAGGFTP